MEGVGTDLDGDEFGADVRDVNLVGFLVPLG